MPSFLWSVVEFDGDVDVGSAPDLPARAGPDSIEVKSRFVFGSRWVSFRCLLVQQRQLPPSGELLDSAKKKTDSAAHRTCDAGSWTLGLHGARCPSGGEWAMKHVRHVYQAPFFFKKKPYSRQQQIED